MGVCLTPTQCITDAADLLWDSQADKVQGAAGQMITTMFGWWTTTPPLDLNTALVHTAQNYVTTWIALPMAVLAILAAVGWGVLSGGYAWVADVARGLLVFGIVATASIPITAALQTWSTSLSPEIPHPGLRRSEHPFGLKPNDRREALESDVTAGLRLTDGHVADQRCVSAGRTPPRCRPAR
jgi:hypothetical protein